MILMIDVTCAIIRNDENKVLIVQRGENSDHPFKWEFPGGKLRTDETEEDCIIREIKEELSIDIVICRRLEPSEFDYGIKKVKLIPFVCDTLDEIPILTEHIAFRWIGADHLGEIDFSEADVPVAQSYFKHSVLPVQTGEDQVSGKQIFNEEEFRTMVGTLMGTGEAEYIARSAFENEAVLRKLQEYSFSDDRKLAFHSSWILSKVYEKYPEIAGQNLNIFIDALDSVENESVLRSFLKIISLSELGQLTQKHHGILADCCFRYLRSGTSAIAVKAYSMEIIYKLALIYPELANELSSTINMLEDEGSAGVIARGRIILKKLGGLIRDH
jgi:8-oxo-dGTP diphosphatase